MNLLAVLVSAVAYWVLGSLWYSMLFSEVWSKGLERHGITIKEPTPGQLRGKMLLTFIGNLAAAFAIGWLMSQMSIASIADAIPVGAVAGIGLSATSLAVAYTWESKPASVYLVDAGYHTVGSIIVAVILGAWR